MLTKDIERETQLPWGRLSGVPSRLTRSKPLPAAPPFTPVPAEG